MVEYLVDLGVNINFNNDMALLAAIKYTEIKQFEIVKFLVDHGAIGIDNALVAAIKYTGEMNLIRYLVKQGADIHANNNHTIKTALSRSNNKITYYLEQVGNNKKCSVH